MIISLPMTMEDNDDVYKPGWVFLIIKVQ